MSLHLSEMMTLEKITEDSREYTVYILDLADHLKCSKACAEDVAYLRTRHRHTQQLEDELIALHKAGKPPNMNEFGCTKETGKALLNATIDSVVNKYTPTSGAC